MPVRNGASARVPRRTGSAGVGDEARFSSAKPGSKAGTRSVWPSDRSCTDGWRHELRSNRQVRLQRPNRRALQPLDRLRRRVAIVAIMERMQALESALGRETGRETVAACRSSDSVAAPAVSGALRAPENAPAAPSGGLTGAASGRLSREPRAESREPRAESREPRAESREPRAESREPRAESREPRAESRGYLHVRRGASCLG